MRVAGRAGRQTLVVVIVEGVRSRVGIVNRRHPVQTVIAERSLHAARVVSIGNQAVEIVFNLPRPGTVISQRIAEVVVGIGLLFDLPLANQARERIVLEIAVLRTCSMRTRFVYELYDPSMQAAKELRRTSGVVGHSKFVRRQLYAVADLRCQVPSPGSHSEILLPLRYSKRPR